MINPQEGMMGYWFLFGAASCGFFLGFGLIVGALRHALPPPVRTGNGAWLRLGEVDAWLLVLGAVLASAGMLAIHNLGAYLHLAIAVGVVALVWLVYISSCRSVRSRTSV